MIDKWKSLTQDNQVKLIIPILIAVLAVVGYFWKKGFESTPPLSSDTMETVKQTTSGESSPAISGTKGDVTINITNPDTGKRP